MTKTITSILILAVLALTGCSTTSSTSRSGFSSSNAGLPIATQLVAGTMKLEGTSQQVSAEQAKALLSLWQVYGELITSDTAAQQEIDGLLDQIQQTMTSQQMQAINNMHLTQADILSTLRDQGAGRGSSQNSTGNQRNSNGRGFTPPEGGFGPPGGSFGGQGFGGGGANLTPDQIATAQASRSTSGGGVGLQTTLIKTLIEILKARAGS
jgi:hypothetical protein